jgi:hypothetical protein
MALLPLRVFLGVTFVYAGVQKLSDPGFLHPGAATYIGTQLHGFADGTPGGFLLKTFAIPHAELAGVGVALIEIAVGLLVLAGLFTRAAAALVGVVLDADELEPALIGHPHQLAASPERVRVGDDRNAGLEWSWTHVSAGYLTGRRLIAQLLC